MTATRSATGRWAHSRCAARAFANAASTSSASPTGIVVSGLPVNTSSMVFSGRAATSSTAARLRKRSNTSADGAAMTSLYEHAGVHDPGRVQRVLDGTQPCGERVRALAVVPRPVVAADRMVVGDGSAVGDDRVGHRGLDLVPLLDE